MPYCTGAARGVKRPIPVLSHAWDRADAREFKGFPYLASD